MTHGLHATHARLLGAHPAHAPKQINIASPSRHKSRSLARLIKLINVHNKFSLHYNTSAVCLHPCNIVFTNFILKLLDFNQKYPSAEFADIYLVPVSKLIKGVNGTLVELSLKLFYASLGFDKK